MHLFQQESSRQINTDKSVYGQKSEKCIATKVVASISQNMILPKSWSIVNYKSYLTDFIEVSH